MKSKALFTILSPTVLLAALAGPPPAGAESYDETVIRTDTQGVRTITVAYADLNLASAAGREALQRRLNRAARQVCGSGDWRKTGSLRQSAEVRQCQRRAAQDALEQILPRQLAAGG